VLPSDTSWKFHIPTIDAPAEPRAALFSASAARESKDASGASCANTNGPCNVLGSPQPAVAREAKSITNIPIPRVTVIACEIVFIEFSFCRGLSACTLLSAILGRKTGKYFHTGIRNQRITPESSTRSTAKPWRTSNPPARYRDAPSPLRQSLLRLGRRRIEVPQCETCADPLQPMH
jgi:hypothetical protein